MFNRYDFPNAALLCESTSPLLKDIMSVIIKFYYNIAPQISSFDINNESLFLFDKCKIPQQFIFETDICNVNKGALMEILNCDHFMLPLYNNYTDFWYLNNLCKNINAFLLRYENANYIEIRYDLMNVEHINLPITKSNKLDIKYDKNIVKDVNKVKFTLHLKMTNVDINCTLYLLPYFVLYNYTIY